MAAARPPRQSIGALIKLAWHEIPDIVAGTCLMLTGLSLAGIGLAQYYARDGDNRKYKLGWVIFRPDDPRAEKVHKD